MKRNHGTDDTTKWIQPAPIYQYPIEPRFKNEVEGLIICIRELEKIIGDLSIPTYQAAKERYEKIEELLSLATKALKEKLIEV